MATPPLLYNGRLYFFASNSNALTCVEAKTGRVLMDAVKIDGLGEVYASPVGADGRVYLVGRDRSHGGDQSGGYAGDSGHQQAGGEDRRVTRRWWGGRCFCAAKNTYTALANEVIRGLFRVINRV